MCTDSTHSNKPVDGTHSLCPSLKKEREKERGKEPVAGRGASRLVSSSID
jgi:hypothetical protein